MEQSSIPSAKFDCPVARQNLSLLATAHDHETGLFLGRTPAARVPYLDCDVEQVVEHDLRGFNRAPTLPLQVYWWHTVKWLISRHSGSFWNGQRGAGQVHQFNVGQPGEHVLQNTPLTCSWRGLKSQSHFCDEEVGNNSLTCRDSTEHRFVFYSWTVI